MIKRTINLYSFEELNEETKQKAIEKCSSINVDYDWWESVYYDAKQAGIKITSFDLDRNRHCKGEFITNAYDVANWIIKDHGKDCTTYKTSKKFLEEYAKREEAIGDDDNPFNPDVNECIEMEEEFLKDILKDYSEILQKEYEYLGSDEAIIKTIIANDYHFTIDGDTKIRCNSLV